MVLLLCSVTLFLLTGRLGMALLAERQLLYPAAVLAAVYLS